MLDRATAMVSDWSARCYVVDLVGGGSLTSPRMGPPGALVGDCLVRPALEPGAHGRCAVATRAGWVSLWTPGRGEVTLIYPKSGGTTQTTCFSPTGDVLAIGLGHYSLSGSSGPAVIECWEVADPERMFALESVALPGASVDWIGWDCAGTRLVAATGRPEQDGGYLVVLDADSLRAEQIHETNRWMISSAALAEYEEHLLLADQRGITCYALGHREGAVCWEWTASESLKGAAFDTGRGLGLTTTGDLIDLCSGQLVEQLASLPGCTDVALLPGGGFIGVSTTGTIRIWNR